MQEESGGKYTEPIPYYACVKCEVLKDVVFTISGLDGLTYLNKSNGKLVNTLGNILSSDKSKTDLISFYAKKKRALKKKDNGSTIDINIIDKRKTLDKYYDISIELYIYKLLEEGNIKPK